jgi:hypothetical protein
LNLEGSEVDPEILAIALRRRQDNDRRVDGCDRRPLDGRVVTRARTTEIGPSAPAEKARDEDESPGRDSKAGQRREAETEYKFGYANKARSKSESSCADKGGSEENEESCPDKAGIQDKSETCRPD